jgi:hypothetical protein
MYDRKSDAIRDVRLLLDYLDISPDNRLLTQFEDTRPDRAAAAPPITKPPCSKYRDFLSRLAAIEKGTQEAAESKETVAPSVDPDLDDLSFLLWTRNFLAIVAAPATLDSIRITHEVIQERSRLAFLPRLANWWKVSLFSSGKTEHPKGDADAASTESISKGARWLARSMRRLEFWLVVTTIVAVLISAYAMVGKYISDQRADALRRFQVAGDALEADAVAARWPAQPDASMADLLTMIKNACSSTTDQKDSSTTDVKEPTGASETFAAAATMQGAQKLTHDCLEFRQESYHLMAEDIRLRSWESILLGGDSFAVEVPGSADVGHWIPSNIIGSIVGPLVGWSSRTVLQVGTGLNEEFCKTLQSTYNTKGKKGDCSEVVRVVVEGTGSTSSAILGFITLYLVPALYSLIGAGTATMRYLRNRVETSTLRITDRHRIAYNLILGCAFGAIIGLFSRYLGSQSSIGPAVVALLAGFNVPAVFYFLGELSNRVFGISEPAAASR